MEFDVQKPILLTHSFKSILLYSYTVYMFKMKYGREKKLQKDKTPEKKNLWLRKNIAPFSIHAINIKYYSMYIFTKVSSSIYLTYQEMIVVQKRRRKRKWNE